MLQDGIQPAQLRSGSAGGGGGNPVGCRRAHRPPKCTHVTRSGERPRRRQICTTCVAVMEERKYSRVGLVWGGGHSSGPWLTWRREAPCKTQCSALRSCRHNDLRRHRVGSWGRPESALGSATNTSSIGLSRARACPHAQPTPPSRPVLTGICGEAPRRTITCSRIGRLSRGNDTCAKDRERPVHHTPSYCVRCAQVLVTNMGLQLVAKRALKSKPLEMDNEHGREPPQAQRFDGFPVHVASRAFPVGNAQPAIGACGQEAIPRATPPHRRGEKAVVPRVLPRDPLRLGELLQASLERDIVAAARNRYREEQKGREGHGFVVAGGAADAAAKLALCENSNIKWTQQKK